MKAQDMPAGPEIDLLVATKVMGWGDYIRKGSGECVWYLDGRGNFDKCPYWGAWSPSVEVREAWEVVNKMSTTTKEIWVLKHGSCMEEALFSYEGGRDLSWAIGEHLGVGETMPLAICRAALLAAA